MNNTILMKTLHLSIITGAGIVFVIIIGLVVIIPTSTHKTTGLAIINNASENICGQFYTAPENQHNFKIVPVLLMDSNSTGCTRLTFTINYNYSGTSWPRISRFSPILTIGNYKYGTSDNSYSITEGTDYTHSFQITVVPETVDLADLPIGSNFTVTYIIKPLPNATGFYDHSIPRLGCEHYPLVVGYTANQVNYSDFSYIYPINPLCESGPYSLTVVEIASMSYKEVTLQ